MGKEVKSIWKDSFLIKVNKRECNEEYTTFIIFNGSLKNAIRYCFIRIKPHAVLNFYSSDGCWIKEICF